MPDPGIAAAPPRTRDLTLRTKLLLTMGALVAGILFVSSALDIRAGHRERRQALKVRAKLVSEALASALQNPIWEYDQEAGQAAIAGALQDFELVSATVTDDTGRTFAAVQNPSKELDPDPSLTMRRPVQHVSPTGEVRALGTVELSFSKHRLDRKLQTAILLALLQLLALVTVVTVGILLGLRRFTAPLEELTAIMRRRAEGDLSLDVKREYVVRRDEIGAIAQSIELDQQQRRDESRLLGITSEVASDAQVEPFLRRLADAGRDLLDAGQCAVYVFDKVRDVLWSVQGPSDDSPRVEFSPAFGHTGRSFTTGEVVNLVAGASDVDETGWRSILCVPMVTKAGHRVGVIEARDKVGGRFTERDELRLRSLAAQAGVALEIARLLDEVMDEKAYTESILGSLSDAVVSLDPALNVAKVNAAATRLFGWKADDVRGKPLRELLPDAENDYELGIVQRVADSRQSDNADDTDLLVPGRGLLTVNLNATPLANAKGDAIGSLFVVEDITSEKRVRGTMARYLPKKVIDQLLDHNRGALGGSSQTMTALFSDIRGFTTISEEIGARETVAMLNEYFTEMIEVLDRHNGILDKFIGDAVMAIFGVPFEGEHDADNAHLAAVEMIRSLDALNVLRKSRGQPPIAIGVGLNTGEAVAGNIGSPKRMSYTVIGDSVNLASRLEGATKQYGASILMSGFTHDALKDRRWVREVDMIRVKGKTRPVGIYESLAYRDDRDSESMARAFEATATGLAHFRAQRWTEARAAFEALHTHQPDHKLSRIYLDRIARYVVAPPPADWDGVFVMTGK